MVTKKTETKKTEIVKEAVRAPEAKKVKIEFTRNVVCNEGTFKPGDIVELEEKRAEKLIKITGAKKC